MEKRKRLYFQHMELSLLKQAIEECHKLAKVAKTEEKWQKIGVKAEYLVMRLSKKHQGAMQECSYDSEGQH